MCTTISHSTAVHGAGKGAEGWFPLTQATAAYDHPAHTGAEHAVLLDFTNYERGTSSRVGVEMDLVSARSFLEQLRRAVEAAEAMEAGDPDVGVAARP